MCGHPVVFYIGISHLGHLFVKNKKQIKPTSVFRSKLFDCVNTASHLGHFWSQRPPHLHFYSVNTQSHDSDGHFSISLVKDVYFLNRNSSNSFSYYLRRLLRAMQTSIGSLPSKGEMISLPTLYEICVITVLICWYQQLQQIPRGRKVWRFPKSQLEQQISQVSVNETGLYSCYSCTYSIQINYQIISANRQIIVYY